MVYRIIKKAILRIEYSISNRFYSKYSDEKLNKNFIVNLKKKSFHDTPTQFLPTLFKNHFSKSNQEYLNHEYIVHFNLKTKIDPQFGWVMVGNFQIVMHSIPYAEEIGMMFPSVFRKIYLLKKPKYIPIAISLQYRWDNYWHFFNDILCQLNLFDKYGIAREVPIIAPKKALEFKYFKSLLETNKYLKSRNWIFLDRFDHIEVGEIYFGKNYSNLRENLDDVVNRLFGALKFRSNTKRIFLKRGEGRSRRLKNSTEIEEIVRLAGFQIIDCDLISIQEQIFIFSQAKVICGLHGAGLTNLIFCKPNECLVFEIFTASWIGPHYYWLSMQYGFKYTAICGEEQSSDKSFYLNPSIFQLQLNKFIELNSFII